jgi:hypothetical protein
MRNAVLILMLSLNFIIKGTLIASDQQSLGLVSSGFYIGDKDTENWRHDPLARPEQMPIGTVWRIYLYINEFGKNRVWGMISEESYNDALNKLENGQKVDRLYCKAIGKTAPCGGLEHFNPFGPIAIKPDSELYPQYDAREEVIFSSLKGLSRRVSILISQLSLVSLGAAKAMNTPTQGFAVSGANLVEFAAVVKKSIEIFDSFKSQHFYFNEKIISDLNALEKEVLKAEEYAKKFDYKNKAYLGSASLSPTPPKQVLTKSFNDLSFLNRNFTVYSTIGSEKDFNQYVQFNSASFIIKRKSFVSSQINYDDLIVDLMKVDLSKIRISQFENGQVSIELYAINGESFTKLRKDSPLSLEQQRSLGYKTLNVEIPVYISHTSIFVDNLDVAKNDVEILKSLLPDYLKKLKLEIERKNVESKKLYNFYLNEAVSQIGILSRRIQESNNEFSRERLQKQLDEWLVKKRQILNAGPDAFIK